MPWIALCLVLSFCNLKAIHLYGQDFYWEEPSILVKSGARFPKAAAGRGVIAVAWQEFIKERTDRGVIYLNLKISSDGKNWTERGRCAGPFAYAGSEVPVFSLAVDEKGAIYLAVSSSEDSITILKSIDFGENFSVLAKKVTFKATVSPRLFIKGDGTLILFATQETQDSLSIFYSLSEKGETWTDFFPLVSEQNLKLNFLPYYISYRGRDYVVFQSFQAVERVTYQLYLKISLDGGKTWGPAKYLTGFKEVQAEGDSSPNRYDNQRPVLAGINGKLALAWERRFAIGNPQIYYAELSLEGELLDDPEKVTTGVRTCRSPQIIIHKGRVLLLWFDNRKGDDHIILAVKRGYLWNDSDLSPIPGVSTFGQPIEHNGELYLLWENQVGNTTRLVLLEPDRSVIPPLPKAVNFTAGARMRQDSYTVTWNLPADSSEVAGFSYQWDRNPDTGPPKNLLVLPNNRTATIEVKDDGYWYFHLAAQDYAGNWCDPVTLSFYRDTTPPGQVTFKPLETDEEGFLASNSFTVSWEPPEEDPIEGYSYVLTPLGSLDQFPAGQEAAFQQVKVAVPSDRAIINTPRLYYRNRDDGVWAFTVRAIDSVGNAGLPKTVFFKLNKYIPETYITDIDTLQDELGRISLTIRGRGFSADGLIQEVIVDTDGKPPYDYTFTRGAGIFNVATDRLIEGPAIEDVNEGTYRVGLIHPQRGLYFSQSPLRLESLGTVKFGDFRQPGVKGLRVLSGEKFSLNINYLVVWIIVAFLGFIMLFSIQRIGAIAKEGRMLKAEVLSLITGSTMPASEKKARIMEMKKRGMGLRIKFTLFITMLVIVVVLMVSLPLGLFMIDTQQKNLAEGLRQQTEVLLESLVSAARTSLPRKDPIELNNILLQKTAMPDAVFVTITGQGQADPVNFNYVWATDDPDISKKTGEEKINYGVSRLQDDVTSKVEELKASIDKKAIDSVGKMTEEIDRLGRTARELALSDAPGAAEELAKYQDEIKILEQKVNSTLLEIGNITGSVPSFDITRLSREHMNYTFYKPIVFTRPGEPVYFRGLVRLGVSTGRILSEIVSSIQSLIIRSTATALVAIGLGIVGALVLASITIIPISKLVRG
ncbi:MAG: sialidase family protein, partial [Spirochaetota bacterium]